MNQPMKIMTVTILAATLSLSACSTGSEATTSGQTPTTTASLTEATSLRDQARNLGERAREAAEDALGITQEFLSGLTDREINADTFRSAWESLKEKLQEMADNANTQEARDRINEVLADLELRFNDILERINSNESVQEIKEAISEFWNEASTKISELMN